MGAKQETTTKFLLELKQVGLRVIIDYFLDLLTPDFVNQLSFAELLEICDRGSRFKHLNGRLADLITNALINKAISFAECEAAMNIIRFGEKPNWQIVLKQVWQKGLGYAVRLKDYLSLMRILDTFPDNVDAFDEQGVNTCLGAIEKTGDFDELLRARLELPIRYDHDIHGHLSEAMKQIDRKLLVLAEDRWVALLSLVFAKRPLVIQEDAADKIKFLIANLKTPEDCTECLKDLGEERHSKVKELVLGQMDVLIRKLDLKQSQELWQQIPQNHPYLQAMGELIVNHAVLDIGWKSELSYADLLVIWKMWKDYLDKNNRQELLKIILKKFLEIVSDGFLDADTADSVLEWWGSLNSIGQSLVVRTLMIQDLLLLNDNVSDLGTILAKYEKTFRASCEIEIVLARLRALSEG